MEPGPMTISVVNGYLCMNSCDAAKARTGQDPHASTTTGQSNANSNNQTSDTTNAAAVVYGGILASLNNSNSVNPAVTSASTSHAQSINLLV
jgi:hypothetical protein